MNYIDNNKTYNNKQEELNIKIKKIPDNIEIYIYYLIHNIKFKECMNQLKLIACLQCKCKRCKKKKYRIH